MATTPQPARPEEWPAAFRLLFRHYEEIDRAGRIDNAIALLERGDLNPDGVLVLRHRSEITGVLTCLPLPGALALVWPPQCTDGVDQTEGEDRLLQHAADWLRGRGSKMAQSLFPPDAIFGTKALERNGFVHLTHLGYLRHTLDLSPHILGTPARLEFATVEAEPACFADTLMRSYEGTLDFPEVNDLRSAEEILDGHRSEGLYDPNHWWLAKADGRPVGVLLTAVTPDSEEWDVAYVGVVPEARRRGFGKELMLKALTEARAADVPGVTLCVDGRNHPAAKLYRELGFSSYDRREVYLAIWR